MKNTCPVLRLIAGFVLFSFTTLGQTKISADQDQVAIENNAALLTFNLKSGYFTITSKPKNSIVIEKASFQAEGLSSASETAINVWEQKDINDQFGPGKSLVITSRFTNYADIIWEASLYDNKDFFVFRMGVINDTKSPYILTTFFPLKSNEAFRNYPINKNFAVLNGNSGGNNTFVKDTARVTCFNNILVRFGELKDPEILVAGGLTYADFEKFCRIEKLKNSLLLQIWSEDPVGKMIDPGTAYESTDKFYLCVNNSNPFEAAEKYGIAVKEAQHIRLNCYDFPTECLWYASVYAKDPNRPKFNDSKGAVDEMDNAIKSGFTKYTRVAIRLVPDAYGPNNQQGWWDDKHWAMWGDKSSAVGANYIEPYITTDSWCREVIKKGGLPMTYFQTNRRSEDFVSEHPGYMLFNDPYKISMDHIDRLKHNCDIGKELSGYLNQWWSEFNMYGYDFTDPEFIGHMKNVYTNLKKAGIKGIMYDYPEATGWAFAGGFEDKHSTTANAYRNIFKLASEGLGQDAYIDERMLGRGTDVALGLTASQRIWGDNDVFVPEMVVRSGLRWYKNRVVVNYDLDSKDPFKAKPLYNNEGLKTLMTMAYVVSARFLLARGFYQLSPEQLFIMSRTFPYHSFPRSSRPINAFNPGVKVPQVFDYEVNPAWHQLTLYNPNPDSLKKDLNKIEVNLGKSLNEGGLALDNSRNYYLYDFWNDRLIGKFSGSSLLRQELRKGETRMISIHAEEKNPQFISTNRHIMQGLIDFKRYPEWQQKRKELSGISKVIGGETYRIIIALNGYHPASCKAPGAKTKIELLDKEDRIAALLIDSKVNTEIKWSVFFKN
jgi:hypothetical protein